MTSDWRLASSDQPLAIDREPLTTSRQSLAASPSLAPQPPAHQYSAANLPGAQMTTVQRVAQIFGVGFLIVGLAGLFATHTMEEATLFGLFPVNLLHNLVHLAFGAWGLIAARSFAGARTYARITGIAYLALAVLGWIDPTGFGLVPIGAANVWLHLLIGAVLTFFGFTARDEAAPATA